MPSRTQKRRKKNTNSEGTLRNSERFNRVDKKIIQALENQSFSEEHKFHFMYSNYLKIHFGDTLPW